MNVTCASVGGGGRPRMSAGYGAKKSRVLVVLVLPGPLYRLL